MRERKSGTTEVSQQHCCPEEKGPEDICSTEGQRPPEMRRIPELQVSYLKALHRTQKFIFGIALRNNKVLGKFLHE